MPAKSKQQFKFMKAVESGSVKAPGLSKEEAADYTKGNVGKKSFKKLRGKIGCKGCSEKSCKHCSEE
jgi:hypothetical protein